ncbi:MAG: transposase [Terriglobia bacterium]
MCFPIPCSLAATSCCSPSPASEPPAPCTPWPSSRSCPPAWTSAKWVASAGLDPREYTSGTSVHKKVRISKAGNKHLRRALYMPALVAVRHQANLRAFYEHLLARGKTKLQALVAAMRKLLHAIYGMFKHDQLFDGGKVYDLANTTALAQKVA